MEAQPLNDGPGVRVSMFDYSVENHLRAINTISKLCGEPENDGLDECDIQRPSSSITFIREWRHFSYEPRIVRFASESECSKEKYVSSEVNLLQFSSATVPKKEEQYDGTTSAKFCKDFIMYVGGSVWALDWCPRVHENPDGYVKCEFIAVAAHPPESYYHKIGAPLIGRGIIQIWCMLNIGGKEEEAPPLKKKRKQKSDDNGVIEGNALQVRKPRGRPRKHPEDETNETSSEVKRPRGRPKKKPIDESLNNVACENQSVQHLDVEFTEGSFQPPAIEGVPRNTEENAPTKGQNKNKKGKAEKASVSKLATRTPARGKRLKSKARSKSYDDNNCLLSLNQSFGASIPKDIALPRVVLCLAHNGKVAWDVKWQPYNVNDSKCKQRMGYLAVLLGNGSLEVWEVPLPRTIGVIYSSSQKDGIDPRFVKLDPVFICSKLKCGDVQSIPLTVEWSTSPPHNYLLAGCHDGMVALWKFSPSGSPKDTKPVLCFSADTVPIRSVAWAPSFSDSESSNVIVTAGHRGLKFWDIRDPFHPLWDCHPHPRFINSLDWLPDPRCVILSFDDGSMRMLSLAQAANDVPVTGKAFTATKQQGLNTIFTCSSFAIWSVQVSRLTGLVAYCSAEGTAICFQLQLTAKAVDRYFSRNRAPHFLCGSLTEEGSTITVNTPLPNVPLPFKKSISDSGESPKSLRSFLTESKQIKRANDKKAKGSSAHKLILAPCHDNDPGVESESEETLAALNNKKKPKSKSSNKHKAEQNQALAIRSEDVTVTESQENGTGEAVNHDVEALPPKILAMHRVRWNMNKGSERWLCYGGAAGIVRCQQILVPIVGKKSAWKS
ncbi:hypothetical protein SLEP1_g11358 [Rubroshorea leprosula]|uniref:DNA binding protein n=1 Tax=Rubroshorea leprosula TaxID=152421 RepID=A0AAV5IJ15_9ROSI|nr:hypothetical protein SLEP1_g11358 [Rubroshorea leprosula]